MTSAHATGPGPGRPTVSVLAASGQPPLVPRCDESLWEGQTEPPAQVLDPWQDPGAPCALPAPVAWNLAASGASGDLIALLGQDLEPDAGWVEAVATFFARHPEAQAAAGCTRVRDPAAADLAVRGFAVTVYEALPQAGGMLRWGIPEYRLPGNILDYEIELIRRKGVNLIPNCRIGKDISPERI